MNRRLSGLVPALCAAALPGCAEMMMGDGAYSSSVALRRAKEADAALPKGRPVAGAEISALLTGRTHVFHQVINDWNGKKVGEGDNCFHFQPGGRLTIAELGFPWGDHLNDGTWSVEGDVLTIVDPYRGGRRRDFTLAVAMGGQIQYRLHSPGGAAHGLVEKLTDSVLDGPPLPASAPAKRQQQSARPPLGG